MRMTAADLETLQQHLRGLEVAAPETDAWPAEALRILAGAGCWRECVPAAFGGDALSPAELLGVYAGVGAGSLTLALILTQHDRACELIATGDNPELARQLLPRIAQGDVLTTVGISQLTTSRRHSGPSLRAARDGKAFRLDGTMPWVTSAMKADYIVAGAVLDDGDQVLACVPTDSPGLTVQTPMRLMALNRSWTSAVRCDGIMVAAEHMVRTPAEKVLTLRAAIKPSAVAAVGLGVAGALLDEMRRTAAAQGKDFEAIEADARQRTAALRHRLHNSADALAQSASEGASMELRAEVNDLLGRLAASVMVMAKGSGYLADHPAQRLAREALFFMVWSAPQPVQLATLRRLWGQEP